MLPPLLPLLLLLLLQLCGELSIMAEAADPCLTAAASEAEKRLQQQLQVGCSVIYLAPKLSLLLVTMISAILPASIQANRCKHSIVITVQFCCI
jgi:hypothetical protein